MMKSFSIIVPVYNCEKVIVRTLESIEASINFFYEHADPERQITSEIVLINDGSGDESSAVIQDYIQEKSNYQLIEHAKSLGAGPARNIGAKIAKGEVIFFMDGDDLFYPEHVWVCLKVLGHQPDSATPNTFTIPGSNPPLTIELPLEPVGIVKTGIATQDKLHPYWKAAIENGAPINFCLWKACHEFVEGYPEAAVYKRIGREDIPYYSWLLKFFKIHRIHLDTTEYIRYPNNNLDRQIKKFQTPPELCQPESVKPEDRELHLLANQLEEERLKYLFEKVGKLQSDRIPIHWMNWQSLAQEFLMQQKYAQVLFLCEKGVEEHPATATQVSQFLAVSYNNLGSAQQQQGNLEAAATFFKQAIQVNPNLALSDLARIYYNVATVLKAQNKLAEALTYLQKSVELDANLTQAVSELAYTQYTLHNQQKDYQFSQDWFSHNLLIWEQFLHPLKSLTNLRILEIGSWEGRSTCWLLENIATDSAARITCIDSFEGSVEHKVMVDQTILKTIEQRFDWNLEKTGTPEKVRKVVGKSQIVLRSLIPNTYHLAYIDGSHIATDVLEDALLTWRLVKIGGFIIFDDYGFVFAPEIAEEPPKVAIDVFLQLFNKKVKLLHQSYQVILEKVAE
jgi:glycosyltransferase involved in cell wall biosynthesis/predicted O-methyltransferase YrrM/Tfp pilus assembly protein PilF